MPEQLGEVGTLTCLAGEKNAKSKEMIRAKAGEYMERAEKLKNHLAEQDTNRKKPSAIGANGKAANGAAKGKYAFCLPPSISHATC